MMLVETLKLLRLVKPALVRVEVALPGQLRAPITRAGPVVVMAGVVMAVVCFRAAPPGLADAAVDLFNERVVERANASGRAYLTHTRLRGRTCMRIGIGNIPTTEQHLAQVWACVTNEVRELSMSR